MIDLLLQVEWPLNDLWDSAEGFVALACITLGGIGLGSKSMTVAAFGSYILFIYYATSISNTLLSSVAYISLTIICVGLGFKILRTEGWG